jgi:hypothetical protein
MLMVTSTPSTHQHRQHINTTHQHHQHINTITNTVNTSTQHINTINTSKLTMSTPSTYQHLQHIKPSMSVLSTPPNSGRPGGRFGGVAHPLPPSTELIELNTHSREILGMFFA